MTGAPPVSVEACARALERAVALPDARVIVRAHDAAIAEVMGDLRVEARGAWLRLGDEQRPHVHLRASEVRRIRFRRRDRRNSALELLGDGGRLLVRVAFGRTNASRPDTFSPDRLAEVEAAFSYLEDLGG